MIGFTSVIGEVVAVGCANTRPLRVSVPCPGFKGKKKCGQESSLA